jgi:hypothetical protein
MAITRVQQTQISGSLSQDDTLAAGSGLAAKSTLKGDLDALRSQVKRIVGGANWYTALEGSQDLADIYTAVHMSGANADFQGTLDVTGAAVFDSTLSALSIDIGGGSGGSGVSIGSDGSITADFSISGLSLAIGGGYGNTGASISSAGVIQADGAVEALSLAIGGGYGASGLSVSSAGALSMDGALVVLGASTLAAVAASGDLVIATDKFSVASASGNTVIAGTLGVAGMGSFDGGISVESGKLAVANGGSGVTMDGNLSVALTSSLAKVTVSSTLGVTGMSSLGMLGASGAATFASTVGVTGASTFANVSNAFNALSVSGSNGLAVAGPSSLVGAVGITGILSANSPSNVMNGLSVTGSNGLSVSSNLLVAGNATVNGDLYVKGATTYIQTDNMIVKDAFIYLATGSAGTSDSGLVLSRGAGASWDLILGQDSGEGEFVFAKQSVQGAFSSPAVIAASALVPAWMSVAKIGANEGTMVGSLSKSGSDLLVKAEASAALKLTAFGDEEFSLAADGAAALFDTAFTATTIIGALLETKAAVVAAGAGGNLSKVSYAGNSAAISAGVLTFVGQTLASADHKLADIYLNGVMLSPTNDLTAITTSSVTLAAGIASSLIADDVIVVIARG